MPKVQIQIITHNSKKHLERLFAGITKQKDVDPGSESGTSFTVLVIDNASTDGTREQILKQVQDDGICVLLNDENKGFARAHNQGFRECDAPYVLVLNPDVELQEGCLGEMVRVMEEPPLNFPLITGGESQVAAVCPKTYKILPFGQKSGIIDSLGIKILPWGQVANIGENRPENAKFGPTEGPQPPLNPPTESSSVQALNTGGESQKVWGVSGACALYRVKALKAVKDEYGIFDERFWMYKEDADLAWRLNRAGFTSKLAPKAVALHQRSVQKGDRQTRPDRFKQESIKNHVLMLQKNLSWGDWWRMPFIVGYEVVKFIYIVLFERRNVKAYSPGFPRTRE